MIAPEQTLADLLEAAAQADRGSLTFIEGERDELTLNYGQLLRRAFGILWHFQQRGLVKGLTIKGIEGGAGHGGYQ